MITIVNKQNSFYYLWSNNCDCWNLVDTATLSVKQESMPAGASEQLHFHNQAQQFFFILKGTATFYVEGETATVTAQNGLLILPGQKHIIANEAAGSLDFLVISQPSTNNDRVTMSFT